MHDKSSAASLPALVRRLYRHISRKRRYQFILLLGLTLASSVAEVASLGAVFPFLGILLQPDKVFKYPLVAAAAKRLGFLTAAELVLPLTLAFIVAAIVCAVLRLLLLWTSIKLSNAISADLSIQVYSRTLYQPYQVHLSRNSSQIISGITQKVRTTTMALMSFVSMMTTGILFLAILLTLLAIDPVIAASAVTVFGAAYALIAWRTRFRLVRNSRYIAREQTQVVKSLQEGLGAIRDVLLDSAQSVYCNVYNKSIRLLLHGNGQNSFINQFPRFAIEAIGVALISALTYIISKRPGGIQAALPVIGALALGAQRLLPLLQQFYAQWSFVTGSHGELSDVIDLLNQPVPENAGLTAPAPFAFKDTIRFDNVRFRYGSEGPWVIDGISLTIQKGTRIGLIGTTGSGKSTMMDLLVALLDPVEGAILVDGRNVAGGFRREWQRSIAHVPQNIFLADSTMAENIAFCVPPKDINMDRVRQAAVQAQIAEFIESRPGAYEAFVGERGIRLSGGQRQRVAIARALYKQATLLVFDEATSSLDNATEKMIMNTIEALDKNLTILMIAHRFTTLQHCDTIIQLERGRIISQGSYEHFRDLEAGREF